ncbi:hypothetical protein [Micromonospora sp. S-DT3-3-22]|uniref:hypothetical protein n=1 Tax=Micromonospora sp. S-DT3-3-22 TaxID=2755359 RepID=UPI001E554395|nr:hypothetical protein [Micromonospora sp. S-DT3-3-22]
MGLILYSDVHCRRAMPRSPFGPSVNRGHGREAVLRVEGVGPDVSGADAHHVDAGGLSDAGQTV